MRHTANGQAPKNPLQNRQIKIVWRSLPTATAMENIENPNDPRTSGNRRPFSSEKGAHKIGPVANPSTYNDTPRMPTSVDTPNMTATSRVAALKIELPNAAVFCQLACASPGIVSKLLTKVV